MNSKYSQLQIGVLALQGAFAEHQQALCQLGVPNFQVRNLKDLNRHMDGLIIPGGESTAMALQLHTLGMMEPLRTKIKEGLPVFGTCAGMILLAEKIDGGETAHLATMHIAVKRNAYGRQLGSFITTDRFAETTIPMTFIRGPYIEKAAEGVEILSTVDGKKVAARQANMLACAFHPELTGNHTVLQYFLEKMVLKH